MHTHHVPCEECKKNIYTATDAQSIWTIYSQHGDALLKAAAAKFGLHLHAGKRYLKFVFSSLFPDQLAITSSRGLVFCKFVLFGICSDILTNFPGNNVKDKMLRTGSKQMMSQDFLGQIFTEIGLFAAFMELPFKKPLISFNLCQKGLSRPSNLEASAHNLRAKHHSVFGRRNFLGVPTYNFAKYSIKLHKIEKSVVSRWF